MKEISSYSIINILYKSPWFSDFFFFFFQFFSFWDLKVCGRPQAGIFNPSKKLNKSLCEKKKVINSISISGRDFRDDILMLVKSFCNFFESKNNF